MTMGVAQGVDERFAGEKKRTNARSIQEIKRGVGAVKSERSCCRPGQVWQKWVEVVATTRLQTEKPTRRRRADGVADACSTSEGNREAHLQNPSLCEFGEVIGSTVNVDVKKQGEVFK